MRKIITNYSLSVILMFSGMMAALTEANAQVLVNRLSVDTAGHPNLTYRHLALTRGSGNSVYVVGNTYTSGEQENFLVVKYTSGAVSWTKEFNSLTYAHDFGIDATAHGDDLYVAGIKSDSLGADAAIQLISLKQSDGGLNWNTTFYAPSGETAVPTQVLADGDYVYVAGTMETSPGEYGLIVLKYSTGGTLKWSAVYDSTGLKDGAAGIKLRGSSVIVTGASGSSTSSWDMITLTIDSNGTITKTTRSNNGNGSFSQAVDMAQDAGNNTYVLGAASSGGINLDYKLIKYDSAFQEIWVRTWGDSLPDEPRAMEMDAQGNYVITGYTTQANGTRAMATLKYAPNGNLLWSNIVPGGCAVCSAEGVDIHTVQTLSMDTNVYVTGKMFNGTDYDYLTVSYSPSGELRWLKTYDSGIGTNDEAQDIVMDDIGTLYISGTSTNPTDTSYLTVRYEQWRKENNYELSISGKPVAIKNQYIVRFDPALIKPAFANNKDIVFSDGNHALTTTAINYLNSKLGQEVGRLKVVKIFKQLSPADTLTLSRLGEVVRIPDFWTSLLLMLPEDTLTTSQAIIDSLNSLFPHVRYAHAHYVAALASGSNDIYYSHQHSLHDTGTFSLAHINVEEAWDIVPSGGLPTIKCGVFDTGLDWQHEDFGYDDINPNSSKVVDGWKFDYATKLKLSPVGDAHGHGTNCGGVLGAIRNNYEGVAGVAGGSATDQNTGVSLYGLGILTPYFVDTASPPSLSLEYIADAIVTTAIDDPLLAYGYGLHFSSNSWRFYEQWFSQYTDSNIAILSDAVHFVNRMNITFCVARGNEGYDNFAYPAIYDDDWVINVGGTGTNGCYYSEASYGHHVDVGAPASDSLIYTLSIRKGWPWYGYESASQTSLAAPHVAGVVGLLMSYLNSPSPSYNNLAPEDCEWIIQLSAKDDTCAIGLDEYIGYGLLNAGAALRLVEKPFNKVNHFGTSTIASAKSSSLLAVNDTIHLAEHCTNVAGTWFAKGKYVANTYQINSTVNHPLSVNDSIIAFWPRPSSSTVFPLYDGNNILIPHEKININSCTPSACSMTGYVYAVRDTMGAFLGWLPFDTTVAKAQFEYTVLTRNPLATDVKEVVAVKGKVSLFPNPTNQSHHITFVADKQQRIKITLFNAIGMKVSNVFSGISTEGYNQITNDVSMLASGFYIYSVEFEDRVENVSFIKF